MHAESDQPQQIECPRCGYAVAGPTLDPRDASGSVTCPECGLVSDARTLADDAALPRWFVESRTSDRGFARRFASTFARALQPLSFWRAVRMEHRFSARSLAGFIAGVLLAIHLCTAAAATLHAVAEARAFPAFAPRTGPAIAPQNRPVDMLVADVALALLFPYCPARGGDVMFAAAQGNPDRAVDAGTVGRFISGTVRVTIVQLPIALPEVPMRAGADGRYAAPTRSLQKPTAVIYPSAKMLDILRGLAMAAASGAFPIALILLLLMLPASFRRARIRRTHLMRAAVYALAWVPVVLALVVLWLAIAFAIMPARQGMASTSSIGGTLVLMFPIGTLCFSIPWMFAFVKRYLRLPQPALITTVLHLLAVLAIAHVALASANVPPG
jgi:hypothetical protein